MGANVKIFLFVILSVFTVSAQAHFSMAHYKEYFINTPVLVALLTLLVVFLVVKKDKVSKWLRGIFKRNHHS